MSILSFVEFPLTKEYNIKCSSNFYNKLQQYPNGATSTIKMTPTHQPNYDQTKLILYQNNNQNFNTLDDVN